MNKFFQVMGMFVLALLMWLGISLLMGFPTMWLVNYLICPAALVAIFGLTKITFWKAFWLNFLCGILFKGHGTSKE